MNDVDQLLQCGLTPLILAVYNNKTKKVSRLIKEGADVNYLPKNGSSSLIHAGRNGNIVIAKILLDAGADVNMQNEWGQTPILTPCLVGYHEIIGLLLDNGAEIDFNTATNLTPRKALQNYIRKDYDHKLILRKIEKIKMMKIQETDPPPEFHIDRICRDIKGLMKISDRINEKSLQQFLQTLLTKIKM